MRILASTSFVYIMILQNQNFHFGFETACISSKLFIVKSYLSRILESCIFGLSYLYIYFAEELRYFFTAILGCIGVSIVFLV